jgi:hypothetical protein
MRDGLVGSDTMSGLNLRSARKLGIASTVVDAVLAFRRGRVKSGLLLLGAAALSKRVPLLGTAVSVLLRLGRKLR